MGAMAASAFLNRAGSLGNSVNLKTSAHYDAKPIGCANMLLSTDVCNSIGFPGHLMVTSMPRYSSTSGNSKHISSGDDVFNELMKILADTSNAVPTSKQPS